jgi:hypothetical protein
MELIVLDQSSYVVASESLRSLRLSALLAQLERRAQDHAKERAGRKCDTAQANEAP